MKKLYSLIKACMTSDMNIFKIKTNKGNKESRIILILFVVFCFMFAMWSYANVLFEKLAPLGLQYIVLSLFIFGISILTIIEGVYKAGPLIFNCKDDELLLSLPIKRSMVLFIRVFKFYVFELLFNAMFLVPLIIAYLRWANSITWTFFLTNIIMFFFLPIIPIIISSIIGVITTSISSKFKYKNAAQIIISMFFLIVIFYLSYNLDDFFNYLAKHATSVNDLITKIYYPAGVYSSLVTDFNIGSLLLFILINLVIFTVAILILSKFYFKINTSLKNVTTVKKTKINNIKIKASSKYNALIKKELNTFFKTPVFIINAGFSLVLFIILAIVLSFKSGNLINSLSDPNTFNMDKSLIMNNLSLIIFILVTFASFMTSITNSVISLEGKNINILKSLPIKTKTILMSKVYSALVLTTPLLVIGDILLCVRFKITIIESLLLILLSLLMPLVSHFIGLIVNLKYPKLDAENSSEIVKQSVSSFLSVMVGVVLLIANIFITIKIVGKMSSILLLTLFVSIYLIINIGLYLYLINKGTKEFNQLCI